MKSHEAVGIVLWWRSHVMDAWIGLDSLLGSGVLHHEAEFTKESAEGRDLFLSTDLDAITIAST